jgi:hypothetical protein
MCVLCIVGGQVVISEKKCSSSRSDVLKIDESSHHGLFSKHLNLEFMQREPLVKYQPPHRVPLPRVTNVTVLGNTHVLAVRHHVVMVCRDCLSRSVCVCVCGVTAVHLGSQRRHGATWSLFSTSVSLHDTVPHCTVTLCRHRHGRPRGRSTSPGNL